MEMDYNSSDTDSDDVFMGPITKREIVARLKYYKILSEEYLEPLIDLKKTDVVDEDLVAFYWNIFTARESMACSENQDRNRSLYQNLEQRKSLYNTETSEQNMSVKRYNTPADSFETEKSDVQSEHFNDSLQEPNCSGLLKESSQINELNQINDSINKDHKVSNCSINKQNEEYSINKNDFINLKDHEVSNCSIDERNEEYSINKNGSINENDSINNTHEVSNCSIDERNEEYSIITISDESYVSNGIDNETLEEIQLKLEDITVDEIENDDIEKQITNSFKNDATSNDEERNTLENLNIQLLNSLKINEISEEPPKINKIPVEMSILSDTFISKNCDIENYCPPSLHPSFLEQEPKNDSYKSDNYKNDSNKNASYKNDSYKSNSCNNDSDSNNSFNDTLEEMELLMKFGENYMEQKQEAVYRDTSTTNSSRSNISEGLTDDTNEIYEKISKQQNTPSSSKTPSIKEIKTPQPKTPSVLKPDNNIDTHFKVPTKAPSSVRKSPNYKSIVSPISLYIKNSPKVPLIKKVNTPTVHSATYRQLDSNKASNENTQEKAIPSHSALPIRTYKLAAKKIFLSKENEPHLPNNIRKLIKGPLNPEIIKHVGRVKATPDLRGASTSTNFSNPVDLTILSSISASDGIFNMSTTSEGDVSLYVSKNAARTNFSTKK